MPVFRFLAILLVVYVCYKLIKLLFIGLFGGRRKEPDFTQKTTDPPKKTKIISKDEGEYVDFEELDKGE